MVDYTPERGDREAVAGEIPGRAQRREGCHRAPARRPLLLLICCPCPCPLRHAQRKGPASWRGLLFCGWQITVLLVSRQQGDGRLFRFLPSYSTLKICSQMGISTPQRAASRCTSLVLRGLPPPGLSRPWRVNRLARPSARPNGGCATGCRYRSAPDPRAPPSP